MSDEHYWEAFDQWLEHGGDLSDDDSDKPMSLRAGGSRRKSKNYSPTPAPRSSARRCKFCNEGGLYWLRENGVWKLKRLSDHGYHSCPTDALPKSSVPLRGRARTVADRSYQHNQGTPHMFPTVQVRFVDDTRPTPTSYTYKLKNSDTNVQNEDFVVAPVSQGAAIQFKLGVVTALGTNEPSADTKYIVQRVDMTAYRENNDKQQEIQQARRLLAVRAKEVSQLELYRSTMTLMSPEERAFVAKALGLEETEGKVGEAVRPVSRNGFFKVEMHTEDGVRQSTLWSTGEEQAIENIAKLWKVEPACLTATRA